MSGQWRDFYDTIIDWPSRYWSHAVLGCLQRLLAVDEWVAIKTGRNDATPFERPLAALDMFVLEERGEGDIDDVSFCPSHPNLS